MLWKANTDIQFVAESTLPIANYVSGYATKDEKSSMQEIWQYGFKGDSGVLVYRGIFSRECSLYEPICSLATISLRRNLPVSTEDIYEENLSLSSESGRCLAVSTTIGKVKMMMET